MSKSSKNTGSHYESEHSCGMRFFMCLLRPFQKVNNCMASVKTKLAHREFERCRVDLNNRLDECQEHERLAEVQLTTTRKRLLAVSRALTLCRSQESNPLSGILSNNDTEAIAIRFRQITNKKNAEDHALQRSANRTAAVRRQIQVLEDAAENAQILQSMDKVARYTKVATHSTTAPDSTMQQADPCHQAVAEMTATLVACCTDEDCDDNHAISATAEIAQATVDPHTVNYFPVAPISNLEMDSHEKLAFAIATE